MNQAKKGKGVTVVQPLASLVARGHLAYLPMPLEADFRGPLLIVANEHMPPWCRELAAHELVRSALGQSGDLTTGSVVGMAELVAVHGAGRVPWGELSALEQMILAPLRWPGCIWELARARTLPEVPCVGGSGLWPVPAVVTAALREQMAGVRG